MTMLEVLVGNLLLYLFMARCYGNSSKMSLVYILSIYYAVSYTHLTLPTT